MLTYQKNGVTTAILAVREFQRSTMTIRLGSNWTEARIGMFLAGVDAHENDLPPPAETLAVADVSDYVTFGLKDSSTYALPGESGGSFIGVRSSGSMSRVVPPSSLPGNFADSSGECSAVGYAGTSLIDGGLLSSSAILFPDASQTEGYNGFYCLKMVVSGRGTGSQAVSLSVARSGQFDGNDYGKSALYQAINNASFAAPRSVIWNTGVAARTLPDAVWVRIPFYNARIRIQEIMALKISP